MQLFGCEIVVITEELDVRATARVSFAMADFILNNKSLSWVDGFRNDR